jgi:hypothetical protein
VETQDTLSASRDGAGERGVFAALEDEAALVGRVGVNVVVESAAGTEPHTGFRDGDPSLVICVGTVPSRAIR